VTVLISKNATPPDLLLAFRFFSRIWGGRYGQILSVDPCSADELTRFRLANSRPEFVYGIDLDQDHWSPVVHAACQPRGFGRLRPEFVSGLRQSHFEDYCLVDDALIHLSHERTRHKGRGPRLRLITPKESSSFSAYCAAVFGSHIKDVRSEFYDELTFFEGETSESFVELATEFAKDRQRSWLDVTAHELTPYFSMSGVLSPTIVLVESLVADLALFWNLRTASDANHPAWILPVPASESTDEKLLEKLKEWLLSFLRYGPRPNHCFVTSETATDSACQNFAARLKTILASTPIESVDYVRPRNRLPIITPFEYETDWDVDVTGRQFSIRPPRLKAFRQISSAKAWIIDLVKDIKTGRAIKELQLPPSPIVFELLNGPCPPRFEHNCIPRTGVGVDSISIRCTATDELVELHLPNGEEILEEILREKGLEPLPDEKRSGYLPVIRRFGGLSLAADAFSGESGAVFTELDKGPRTLEEIKGKCKLGAGILPGKSLLERQEVLFTSASERIKRVGRRRFADYARHQSPTNLKLTSVLEFWADRSVLIREWRLGPCPRCKRTSFEPHLNIQKTVLCPSCGNRLVLDRPVPFGYAVHKTVGLAMREGIVPVVLTGRFLKNMSNRGFLWLPGVKYRWGQKSGDIDLLASCDGELIFCECKRLQGIPTGASVWNEVVSQFLETAVVAKQCGGSLVVLAAQVDEFPSEVRERIEQELMPAMPHLLLDRLDLEKGHRTVEEENSKRHMRLRDLIPVPFPEVPRRLDDKPRTIDFGWSVFTR
jgi:hypothetical protein